MCEVCSKILLLLCRHLKFINFAFKVFRKLVEICAVLNSAENFSREFIRSLVRRSVWVVGIG
jgi:hypothetical protein